jgi:glycosyltransferase involved in cell wall biosynthesis
MMGSAPLTVAIFSSSLGLIRGGLETLAGHFASGLAERGHRVTVVAGAFPGYQPPPDFLRLPVRRLVVPCLPLSLRLLRPLAQRRPALLLKLQSLFFTYSFRMRPAVRRLLATADVSLTFLEVETVLISRLRARQGQANVSYFPGVIDLRWLRRDQSQVRVAISHTIADSVRSLAGLDIDGVVPPGIPSSWLEEDRDVAPQGRRCLFLGRLEANKGVLDLPAIARKLSQQLPDVVLRLAGDGPLRSVLIRAAAEAGLDRHFHLLAALSQDGVRQELLQADLFLFPSRYESFGIAVLEAMASGVPVVASDLAAIREVAGDSARLLPPGDIGQWVTAVVALLNDQQRRQQMVRAGRQRARQFTWERSVEALEAYLYMARARMDPSSSGADELR